MKKLSIVLVIIMAATLLASCFPENPKDVLPYCKESYETLLAAYSDYPPSFIGACVSYYQTEKATAFVSLCGYEPFHDLINESIGEPTIFTKKDCIQYLINFEE